MNGPVLVVVEDLIFLSKIRQTAQHVGVEIEPVEISRLAAKVQQASSRAVILDLNHRSGSAVETARALKSCVETRDVHVLGFLSHVQGELAREARDAGLDQVMARSAFNQQLPELLRQLAGS
jgi:DNA-binding NarL/FixJ family response regulator